MTIFNTGTVDGNLDDLKMLSNLQRLTLASTENIDGDVESLSNTKNLTWLGLFETGNIEGDLSYITDLHDLNLLELYMTDIEGEVDDLISNLLKLTWLEIFDCRKMTGNIENIGTLPLSSIVIGNSDIHGDLSDFSPLTKLTYLELSGSKVNSGSLEDLSHLTNLTGLELSDIPHVTGNLEDLKTLKKLETLTLVNARVEGDLNSMNRLSSLTHLQLEDLKVGGHLSNLKSDMEYLRFKNLNHLDGQFQDIPCDENLLVLELHNLGLNDDLGNLCKKSFMNSLRYLIIANNEIYGEPDCLNNSTQLQSVILNDNHIHGKVD
eukprot:UN30855